MQRSGSQKALLVLSIIEIVFSALGLIAALMAIVATGMVGAAGVGDLVANGVTIDEQQKATAILALLSALLVIEGVWGLLCGIFGVRAANDNQKIMPVWVFTLIGVILGVVSLIVAIVNGSSGQQILSSVFSVAFAGIMFWIANNIKREAGK